MQYLKAFEAWCAAENARLAAERRFDLVIEIRRGPDGRYASERTRQFVACWLAAQQRQRMAGDPLDRAEVSQRFGSVK